MSEATYLELRGAVAGNRGIGAAACVPVAVMLLLAATGWWVASAPLHHDCALFLYYTERYLAGGQLYVDILELNPPLAFWLTVPPVWLARSLGWAPEPVFVAYVAALAGLALGATGRLLDRLPGLTPVRSRLLLLAMAILLGPAAISVFGQREHLLALLVLPYLVMTALRASGVRPAWPVALCIGLLAGTGLLLKPYFLCLPVALELYLLATTRRWRSLLRTDTAALAAAALAYLAATMAFAPAYLEAVVPMLAATYHAYAAPLGRVFAVPELLWFVPAAGVFVLLLRRNGLGRPLPAVLLIAAGCFLAAYVVQQKGWFYQLYPTPAALALWFAAAVLVEPQARRPARWPRWHGVALTCTVGIAATLMLRGPYANGFATEIRRAVAEQSARSIFAFSAQVSIAFPVVQSDRLDWASRFPHLWPLPAAVAPRDTVATEDAVALDRARDYVVDAVVTDLGAARPDLIFVDRRAVKAYFSGPFDYLAFFLADPRFAALWQDYEPAGQTEHFALYRRRS